MMNNQTQKKKQRLSKKALVGLLQEVASIVSTLENIPQKPQKQSVNKDIYSWDSLQILFTAKSNNLHIFKNLISRIDSAKVSFGAKRLMKFMFNDFNERLGTLCDTYEESLVKLAEEFKNKPIEKYEENLKATLLIDITDLISKTFADDYESLQKLGANSLNVLSKGCVTGISTSDTPEGVFNVLGNYLGTLTSYSQQNLKNQLLNHFIDVMFDFYNFGILKACQLNNISMCLIRNAQGLDCFQCQSLPKKFAGLSQNIIDDTVYYVEDVLKNLQSFHHDSCNVVINPIV